MVADLARGTSGNRSAASLSPHDLDGDGIDELVVGTGAGEIAILDPATGTMINSLPLGLGAIHGLTTAALNGDGFADWVLATHDHVYVVDQWILPLDSFFDSH